MLGIHLGNPRLHGNRIGPVLLSSVSSLPGVLNTYSARPGKSGPHEMARGSSSLLLSHGRVPHQLLCLEPPAAPAPRVPIHTHVSAFDPMAGVAGIGSDVPLLG